MLTFQRNELTTYSNVTCPRCGHKGCESQNASTPIVWHCPRCGHKGCESQNASTPIVWHCPRCDEMWNPDNKSERTPIVDGTVIGVPDLRLGDVVTYATIEGTPSTTPYMQMTVVWIEDDGVHLSRPYVSAVHYPRDLEDRANGKVGHYSHGVESLYFPWHDKRMMFILVSRQEG